jgi:thermitase
MKLIATALCAALACASAFGANFKASDGRVCAAERVIVSVDSGASVGRGRHIGGSLHVLDVPPGSEVAEVARLKSAPGIRFAELDCAVALAMTPSDPYYGNAWHLPRIGAPAAWDASLGGGIVVAVMDTGVYGAHADLVGRMVPGWNFIAGNDDTADFMGHGTPVAGTVGATVNNGYGASGVAGLVQIMPLVVTDSTGGSFYSVISQGIIYAADRGAKVASLSFSGLPFSAAVQSAAQYMRSKGGMVVVAAGNTGAIDNVAPTSTMTVVSATNRDDSFAPWSTFGPFVTIAAPGTEIYSTSISGGYGWYGGTSFATPIVAGVLALMMAANPAVPIVEIERMLYASALDLGAFGRDAYYGYGRVDAGRAVAMAVAYSAPPPPADTTPPAVVIASPLDGARLWGQNARISASATDASGIASMSVAIDGQVRASSSAGSISFMWNVKRLAAGAHTITVRAVDKAGNAAATSITVTK